MEINHISVNPSSIARILGVLAFLLVLASIGGQLIACLTDDLLVSKLIRLFNVDAERNLPTVFSALLLLFAALLLAIITVNKRKQTGSPVLHWAILSFGFLIMAYDEVFEYHEMLSGPVGEILGVNHLGVFHFTWVIPGIALVFLLSLFFLKFLLHLPAKTRLAFLVAATLYIGGAIGIELIGGHFAKLYGQNTLTFNMIATVEEIFEMGGIIIFIWALLAYISDNYKEVRFLFEDARRKV